MADNEDLQVLQVHIEHARGTESQRFQHAVGDARIVAGGKRQRVRGHVRVEADGCRRPPAAFRVRRAELLALELRGEWRNALPAHRADGVAELPVPADGRPRRPR